MKCVCGCEMTKNGTYSGRQQWKCSCGKGAREGGFYSHTDAVTIAKAIALVSAGATLTAAAAQFGVTRQTIANFIKKKNSAPISRT